MNDKKIKFGLIGAGHSAKKIVEALEMVKRAEIIGVTAKTEEEATEFAKKYNNITVYPSVQTLLETTEIDVVIISVPHNLHYPLSKAALIAGKHVICEKPLTPTMKEGQELLQLAKNKQKLLATFFQKRFFPSVQKAKQLIKEGAIGRILQAQTEVLWNRDDEYYNKSLWRGKKATEGGGCLINQAIHSIDILLWLLGKPKWVFGDFKTLTHQIEVEDNAAAILLFENNAFGTIQASTSIKPGFPEIVRIYGSEGLLEIEGTNITLTNAKNETSIFEDDMKNNENDYRRNTYSVEAHKRYFEDFIQALMTDQLPLVYGWEGLRAVEIIEAIYESQGKTRIVFASN